jgi:Na+/H+ antiporter NhaC
MTLELIVFIAAILFGILLYWRESNGNGLYRFFNKIINSKELQMKPENKTGFVFRQTFLLRLVFISFLFLIGIVITRFLIPIDIATISIFASMIVGTLLGTYLANFIFKSTDVIEDKSDSLGDLVKDTIEKGKDFVEDLKDKQEKESNDASEVVDKKVEESKTEEKSARERLKDKGLL